MTAPPVKKAAFNCLKKRHWNDELAARAAAMCSVESLGKPRLWVYKCPNCNQWHITSKNQGRRRMVTMNQPFVAGVEVRA